MSARRDLIDGMPPKTTRALLLFGLLAMTPYTIPGLDGLRFAEPAVDEPSVTAAVTETSVETPERPSRPGAIEDPSGRALGAVFGALDDAERSDRIVRVCHYGDSPITNDDITSTVRRRLQERFGDAGHGFVLVDRPWGWYRHDGVEIGPSGGWESQPIGPGRDERRFGLGGVVFVARGARATATISTADGGNTVSAFEVAYLSQAGGGSFDVEVDGATVGRVSTAGEQAQSGFSRFDVPDGPHRLALRTVGDGEVRLFGVTLERGDHGVVYDSLGVNGAYVGLLARAVDPAHWSEQLRHRAPDLVVLAYGTNESQYDTLPMDQYEREMTEAIRRVREAVPEASILVVAPMDRAMRGPGGALVTRPMIPKLVAVQRRIAAETGCAFFDTYTAMGGNGTAARWTETRPRLMGGDYTHPTAQGAEIVGTLLYDAIAASYDDWHSRQIQK